MPAGPDRMNIIGGIKLNTFGSRRPTQRLQQLLRNWPHGSGKLYCSLYTKTAHALSKAKQTKNTYPSKTTTKTNIKNNKSTQQQQNRSTQNKKIGTTPSTGVYTGQNKLLPQWTAEPNSKHWFTTSFLEEGAGKRYSECAAKPATNQPESGE